MGGHLTENNRVLGHARLRKRRQQSNTAAHGTDRHRYERFIQGSTPHWCLSIVAT